MERESNGFPIYFVQQASIPPSQLYSEACLPMPEKEKRKRERKAFLLLLKVMDLFFNEDCFLIYIGIPKGKYERIVKCDLTKGKKLRHDAKEIPY